MGEGDTDHVTLELLKFPDPRPLRVAEDDPRTPLRRMLEEGLCMLLEEVLGAAVMTDEGPSLLEYLAIRLADHVDDAGGVCLFDGHRRPFEPHPHRDDGACEMCGKQEAEHDLIRCCP